MNKMSRKKYSAIWLHFEEEDGQKAKCKHCKAIIRFNARSQSNLSRHLKSKHPLKCLQRHFKKTKINTSIQQQNSHCPKIAPINQIEKTDRKVLKMIAKGHHSFRLVEEHEFRKFIHDISKCSGYAVPTWNALVNGLDSYIDMSMFNSIKEKLYSATAVSLTIDEWTSAADMNYVAVTAHYINSDTHLTSHLLTCGEFENKQSSEVLCNFLHKISVDFDITDKITAIVSDNSPNILAAIGQGGWHGIVCFAHSLNSIAQIVTDEITITVNKAKDLIENLHKNKDLETSIEQMYLTSLKFEQDVLQNWNSTFKMLKSIYQEKQEIIAALSYNHPDLLLDSDDWRTMEDAVSILKPFNEVVKEISEERDLTVSKAVVLCNLLKNFDFKCLVTNNKISKTVTKLQNTLKSKLGNLENDDLFAESVILDPRFKRKGFTNDSSYQQALRTLKEKICNISLSNDESANSELYANAADSESVWRAFDLDFNRSPDNNDAGFELDKYISEEYLDRKMNPFSWWNERKNIYPRVYFYALSRLCIVATIIQ